MIERIARQIEPGSTTRLAKAIDRVFPATGEEYRNGRVKRFSDLAIATPAAILTTPIVGAAIVASAIEHRTFTPFFLQQRRTQNGDHFGVWKLQTMKSGAHEDKEKYREAIEKYGDKADPRITKLGRVLRKYSIDELPQFWQVVGGRMSFIGLRAAPEDAIALVQQYHPTRFEQWQEWYAQGKPALVSYFAAELGHDGRKNEQLKVEYDKKYAEEANVRFDAYVMCMLAESTLNSIESSMSSLAGGLLKRVRREKSVQEELQPVQDSSSATLSN